MRQGGDRFAQDLPIALHVRGADLQKIIEGAGDHVTLLDLRNFLDRGVEGL